MRDSFIIAITGLMFSVVSTASAAACDRACLLDQAKRFNANMLAHTTEKVPLSLGAKIFENAKAVALTDSTLSTVRQIRSQGVYTDAVKGINEIFKILDGRIRLVDNIGLIGSGIATSGFTQ